MGIITLALETYSGKLQLTAKHAIQRNRVIDRSILLNINETSQKGKMNGMKAQKRAMIVISMILIKTITISTIATIGE